MKYISTRDPSIQLTASQAILKGISPEGGLFVPEEFPQVDLDFIRELEGLTYWERAERIMALYLDDFSREDLKACTEGAYRGTFDGDQPAPVRRQGICACWSCGMVPPVPSRIWHCRCCPVWFPPPAAISVMTAGPLCWWLPRRHRQGSPGGLPGRGRHRYCGLLPGGRRQPDPAAADGNPAGLQCGSPGCGRQLR